MSDGNFAQIERKTLVAHSLDESISLAALDLRAARQHLGITSHEAAKRAGLSAAYYRRLENGLVPKSKHILRTLISVCQHLDLKSVRAFYLDAADQYVHLDLSSGPTSGRKIIFLETLLANIAKLHEFECFLSPDAVFSFVERSGFDAILASKKPADKQVIELFIASVFTMCLDHDMEYYVRPVKDDPPDVELLGVERDGSFSAVARLEITQHGKYSESVFEVIGKKLEKRYHQGTMLVVMVEETETFEVGELDEFIRNHNPHGQRLVVIGCNGRPGKFLVVPWDEVSSLSPGKAECLEIQVDQRERSTGFRGYQGIFCKPSMRWRLPRIPLFVKEVVLSR